MEDGGEAIVDGPGEGDTGDAGGPHCVDSGESWSGAGDGLTTPCESWALTLIGRLTAQNL